MMDQAIIDGRLHGKEINGVVFTRCLEHMGLDTHRGIYWVSINSTKIERLYPNSHVRCIIHYVPFYTLNKRRMYIANLSLRLAHTILYYSGELDFCYDDNTSVIEALNHFTTKLQEFVSGI